MHATDTDRRERILHDVVASVVVFLVALPLCMGIAIASGAPPAAGLVSGIIGGLVVGFIGGAPLQVSGPAAGLAVIVYDLVAKRGYAALGAVILLAGVLQIVAGVAKIGRWFQAVPPSVIYGMLAGIGVLILASQFHVMLDDAPKQSGLQNLIAVPWAIAKAIDADTTLPHREAAGIGALTIGLIVVWNGPVTRRWPDLKVVPGALIAIVIATAVTATLALPIARVDVPGSLASAVVFPSTDSLRTLIAPSTIGAALMLAIVASAETLLCATAIDQLHHGPRTNYDRELLAQGIGNALCGALGALPMTGVIVRSSANVGAGARTRLSAILHGVWLLGTVALVPMVLRAIPIAALAALLVFTGYKLMRQDLKALARGGRAEVYIFFATVLGIVATDLLKGVLLGLALAAARLLFAVSRLQIRVEHGEAATRVDLVGSATFLRLPDLNAKLAAIPPDRAVKIGFDELDYIDHASLQAIASWEKQFVARGGRVSLNWDGLHFQARLPNHRPSTT